MMAEMSDMKPDQLIKDRRAKFLAMGSKGLAA
jgi:acetyl-CoA carboxylase carboxyl transferase subunit alpha